MWALSQTQDLEITGACRTAATRVNDSTPMKRAPTAPSEKTGRGQIGKAHEVRFQFNVFGDSRRFFAPTGPLGPPGAIVIVRHSER